MNKQTQLIQNSLPLIAAGLGDKLGIRVTVSGNQAWTDGKTINIPDFNITSKDQKDAVLGFVSHEAAHLKFDSLKDNIFGRINSVAINNFWNIFEDLRIEKAMIESMVGTKNWINQIWVNRQNEGKRPIINDRAAPASVICEFLLMTCRVQYRGQTHLMPYLDAAEDLFCRTFGYKLIMELTDLLNSHLPNLKSSDDALQLAIKVESLIANHEPDADGESDDDADGESDDDVKALIQQALNSAETFDDMEDFASTLECLAKANPECSDVMMPIAKQVMRKGEDNVLTSYVKGTSTQLTAKLQAIVEEEMRVKRKTKTSGLTLNSKVLHRYAVNDARLFKSKTKKRQIDTIVEICIDNSGSMQMNTDLLSVAKEAQLALAMALERIKGVSITASAFPIMETTDVIKLLSEGERANVLTQRYHAVQGCGHHTPTASAMLHCIKTVLESKRSKKVIIMITDGHPNPDEHYQLTKLVHQAQQSGITVIGVAIGAISRDKPKFYQFFPNALFIQHIQELKTELFKVARNILIN